MTELFLNFTFFHADHTEISGNVLEFIRRELAMMMERCHFGTVQCENNRYFNEHAIPITDTYDERVGAHFLDISFEWDLPLVMGEIDKVVREGIPYLHALLHDHYPELRSVIRVQYEQF